MNIMNMNKQKKKNKSEKSVTHKQMRLNSNRLLEIASTTHTERNILFFIIIVCSKFLWIVWRCYFGNKIGLVDVIANNIERQLCKLPSNDGIFCYQTCVRHAFSLRSFVVWDDWYGMEICAHNPKHTAECITSPLCTWIRVAYKGKKRVNNGKKWNQMKRIDREYDRTRVRKHVKTWRLTVWEHVSPMCINKYERTKHG